MVCIGSTRSSTMAEATKPDLAERQSEFPILGEAPRSSGAIPKPQLPNLALPAAVALDECQLGGVRAVLCSRRGVGHAFGNEPRQDDAALTSIGPILIAVVSDGVGSSKQAHVGSYFAVRSAAIAAAAAVREAKSIEKVDGPALIGRTQEGLVAVCQRLFEDGYRPEDIQTTVLLCLCDTRTGRVRILRVGDSDVFGLRDGAWIPLFDQSAEDVVDPSTHCLPQGAEHLEERSVDLAAFDCLLLATDGLARLLQPQGSTVGSYFAEHLQYPLEVTAFHRLVGFERRAALDDRTGLAIWKDQP